MNGKTDNKIVELLKKSSIKVSYFTGELYFNRGHGYKGLGKHTVVFKLSWEME